jgi:molecular chaperone Hsp33
MKLGIMEFIEPANSNELLKNVVLPFMLEESGIRGRFVRINEEADKILKTHKYPDSVSKLIGELLILVSMLGSMLKLKGVLTIQAQGDGAVGFISADYTPEGHLRGYSHIRDAAALKKIKPTGKYINKLFGNGFLVVTIENSDEQPYQAIVPLEGKTLTDCLTNYFVRSDQMEVVLKVAVDKINDKWCAGGIILQRIPEEGGKKPKKKSKQAEELETAHVLLSSVTEKELIDDSYALNTVLYNLFHEQGVRVFESQKLKAECRCTRERMEAALQTLSPAEREEMKVDGVITMTCHFCNRTEVF